MLNDATCFKAVYTVCGYTDLHSGMDRWLRLLRHRQGTGPMSRIPSIFSAVGAQTASRGLVWEGDGWLLLYKRLSESRFQRPRSPVEVHSLTPQQFRWLMEGLTIAPKKSVRPVEPPEYMG